MCKIIKYLFFIGFIIVSTVGCKKDLGNYTYTDINEVIFPGELNGKLTVYVNRQVLVKPQLSFTKDPSGDSERYAYEWVYLLPMKGGGDQGIKTLATTRDLDMMVRLNPGTYDSYFRVTDKETGVQFRKSFKLEVRNEFNEGWMLMTEVDGKSRLSMLSLQEDNSIVTVPDLLAATNSELQLNGKPKLIYSYFIGALVGYGINLDHGMYIGTDQSTDRVHPESFEWQPKYNVRNEILALDVPSDFRLEVIKRLGDGRSYMLTASGDALFMDRTTNIKYGEAMNYANEKIYKLAPFIAMNENGNPTIEKPYFYDVEKRRFLRHNAVFDSKLTTINDPFSGLRFSFNNTGKDLVHMEWVGVGGGEIFAILKDPDGTKYHLACFNARFETQTYYAEILAEDIDKAEYFAFSPSQGYLYYSVGGKVYQYDKNSVPATNRLVLDKGAEKISLLKFHTFHNATKYKEGSRLWVASYDSGKPSDKNAKLEQFEVMIASQGIELKNTYTGFGKVASMHYRER